MEALFPENDLGAPDYRETDLEERILEYLRMVPARARRLLLLLFIGAELAAPLLVPCLSRFSSLPVTDREAAVRRWRRSRLLPLRILGDALKATTTLLYMSHPAALRHVGAFAACDAPTDLQLAAGPSGARGRALEVR